MLAIWCAALLVPWFRQPLFTLIALGIPVAHFYIRAEFGMRAGLAESRRYRNSASVLGFVVLRQYSALLRVAVRAIDARAPVERDR